MLPIREENELSFATLNPGGLKKFGNLSQLNHDTGMIIIAVLSKFRLRLQILVNLRWDKCNKTTPIFNRA